MCVYGGWHCIPTMSQPSQPRGGGGWGGESREASYIQTSSHGAHFSNTNAASLPTVYRPPSLKPETNVGGHTWGHCQGEVSELSEDACRLPAL